MTTFAVLADVHANLEALFAVMADIDAEAPGATIVHCGDVVGYGPQPNEVIDLLRARRAIGVLGNHDARAIDHPLEMRFNPDAEAAILWTKRVLTPASVAWLRELPERLEVGDATLVHGSPRDPQGNIGAFEAALLDPPMADPNQPLEIIRTLHSFDPCLACSTHVMSEDGQEMAQVKVS